jgi:hypothetical protein
MSGGNNKRSAARRASTDAAVNCKILTISSHRTRELRVTPGRFVFFSSFPRNHKNSPRFHLRRPDSRKSIKQKTKIKQKQVINFSQTAQPLFRARLSPQGRVKCAN